MSQPAPPKRTMFAQQAVDFKDYFEMMFTNIVVSGDVPRKVALAAPEGISTGGGKQSLQHILLKPEMEGASTLTAGWIDRAQGTAQLRTYEYLVEQHRQRGRALQLDPATYQVFFEKAQKFLDQEKLPVKIASSASPAGGPSAAVSTKKGLSPLVLLIIVLVLLLLLALVVVGGGVLYYIMMRS
jgi:hypothetical protein